MHRGTGATHYGRRGHIPGSVNVPALTLLDANFCFLGSAGLRSALAPAMQQKRAVVYCGAGISATVTALALTALGHEDVAVYDGSMWEWAASSRPLERGSQDSA